ncbi:DENN domain-containing protein 11-like [Anneissia japonica]|uniref:DENN domain-containing protein 11-like n=1 Tax=Anneissia japonica TaxID=1529436 RepID=UPI0014259AC4|nr:DENN domain-containing protein 11-like [Anneissia japonica]
MEKTPLLVDFDDHNSAEVRQPKSQFKNGGADFIKRLAQQDGDGKIDSNGASVSDVRDFTEGSANIVAIFVVAFDTRSGNVVEWSIPEDIDLEGVEFKAMASGSHTINSDFIFFKKDNYYGLSCYEKMTVDSLEERGARMKSVGILATSYTTLYRHMQFLENQVRHQLETPERYEQLKAFYADHRGSLPSSRSLSYTSLGNTPNASPSSSELLPEMKITHPAGCFAQFINFFGEHIFTIWKFVLLRKRIIFFSPPPIGVVCYRVYCASVLGNHTVRMENEVEVKPQFYINVADIENLESDLSYVACTTEKIFLEKKDLYDVYVDNQNLVVQSNTLKDMLKICPTDKEKFNQLNNQRSAQLFRAQELGEDAMQDDQVFATFFLEMNNHIFQTLLDISITQDKSLTSDHMKSMGLDPIGDRQFIMDLLELYGIDVLLILDNPCCPT